MGTASTLDSLLARAGHPCVRRCAPDPSGGGGVRGYADHLHCPAERRTAVASRGQPVDRRRPGAVRQDCQPHLLAPQLHAARGPRDPGALPRTGRPGGERTNSDQHLAVAGAAREPRTAAPPSPRTTPSRSARGCSTSTSTRRWRPTARPAVRFCRRTCSTRWTRRPRRRRARS